MEKSNLDILMQLLVEYNVYKSYIAYSKKKGVRRFSYKLKAFLFKKDEDKTEDEINDILYFIRNTDNIPFNLKSAVADY